MEDFDIYVDEEVEINITVDENTAYIIEVPGVSAASVLTTKGDLLTYSTLPERLGVGSDGDILVCDSSEEKGIKWSAPAANNIIEQGNSSVEVIDTTAGTITLSVDTNDIMTLQTLHQPITINHAQTFLDTQTPLMLVQTTGTSTTNKGAVLWLGTTRTSASVDSDLFRVYGPSSTYFAIDNGGGIKVNAGNRITEFSTDTTMAGNSDLALPTEKAVKAYTDTKTAKLDYITVTQAVDLDTMESNIATNNAKVTNATHTGEVTGATALTIADNVIDEANLKLDEGPTNGYILMADDSKTGGMKWATVSGASGMIDPMTTRGDIIYRNSSNNTSRLAVGTAGQVLTSDGTDVSWEDATGGSGSGDKIEEGDSSVEVVDAGTGRISQTVDGVEIARFVNSGSAYIDGQLVMGDDIANPVFANDLICLQSNEFSRVFLGSYNSAGGNPQFHMQVSRGSLSSKSAVVNGDRIGNWVFSAHDGTGVHYTAQMVTYIDGAVSTGVVPMRFSIETSASNGPNRVERLSIRASGNVEPGTDDAQDLGSSSKRWDDIYATNTTIQSSDARMKDNVGDCKLGLDFINKLNPVSYKWKDYTVSGTRVYTDEDGIKHDIEYCDEHTHTRTHYGMIAQDVEKVLSDSGIDTKHFAGLIYNEESDRYGLRYNEFIAPMIKAIQELNLKCKDLETQHELLLRRIEALEAK